jgi:hypothetical protein
MDTSSWHGTYLSTGTSLPLLYFYSEVALIALLLLFISWFYLMTPLVAKRLVGHGELWIRKEIDDAVVAYLETLSNRFLARQIIHKSTDVSRSRGRDSKRDSSISEVQVLTT